MTLPNVPDPIPGDRASAAAIETVIVPRLADLGSFHVRRVLPSQERQMVGPFIFLDSFGPAAFKIGEGLDVRPHPHIGLATVTYLFEGEIMHRDSLGSACAIKPGDLNWMTAGKGIVHSERTPAEDRRKGAKIAGLQAWVALPRSHEEGEAAFAHHAEAEQPVIAGDGKTVRIIAGSLYGATAPVKTASNLFYADVSLARGQKLPLDAEYEERSLYLLWGRITISGQTYEPERLLVFAPGERATIAAQEDARFLLMGGAPLEGPRYIWWNFVSSSRERIEQAREDWTRGRFDTVPGDQEIML
jgi:redox-sensitive bicupin YhaK (pirin superfamily)